MPLIICGGSRPLPSRPLSVAQGLSTAHRRGGDPRRFFRRRARLAGWDAVDGCERGDGRAMFVSVGSNSDHGENGIDAEKGRAAILEIDPATGATKVFAAGLRNPVGMDFEPLTGTLWTVVNERDELGGDLVPDYLTSVQAGSFYGWPYSYYGDHLDPRVLPQRPDLVARAQGTGLRPRGARRAARPDLCGRREARPSFCQRCFHWPARFLEPQATVRLSGDLRAVPSGPPGRPTRGSADRIPRRRWQRPRPTGRRCHRQARWSPRRRRRRQRRLAR